MSKRKEPQTTMRGAQSSSEDSLQDEFSHLPEPLREVLQEARLDPQSVTRIVAAFKYSSYQGVWLPPDFVEGYERSVPGAGRLILEALKKRTAVSNTIDKDQSDASIKRMGRGQIFGFCIAALGIAAATLIALNRTDTGALVVAAVIVVASIGGPAVARILATRFGPSSTNRG